MTQDEVAAEIARRLGKWPPAPTAEAPALLTPPAIADSSALLITGPRAVGTSTVAWQVLMASVAAGHYTGYLDVEQLAFLPAALEHASLATKLANISTCWRGFRNQAADRLVLCGHVNGLELGAVRKLIPSLRVVALTAAPETLLQRARRRSRNKDIWLPGDDLFGRDDVYVRQVVTKVSNLELQDADLVVETDGLTAAGIASLITPLWPHATSS